MSKTTTILNCRELISRYCPDLPLPQPGEPVEKLLEIQPDGSLLLAPFAIKKFEAMLDSDPYKGLGVFDTLEISAFRDDDGSDFDAWIRGNVGGFRVYHGYWRFEGGACAGEDDHLCLSFSLPSEVGRFIKRIVKSELGVSNGPAKPSCLFRS